MLRIMSWILALFVIFVFVQSLFFKFTGAPESILIFSLIDITAEEWLGLTFFEPTMRFGVGGAEALASVLLLIPFTRVGGAFVGFVIMTGAIGFHLLTALGTSPSGVVAKDGTVYPDAASVDAIAAIANGATVIEGDTLFTVAGYDLGILFLMACGVWVACLILMMIGSGNRN
ncbi:MAG: hypothetical protein ACFB6R_16185 [Alphaproteobacteria bacterium]